MNNFDMINKLMSSKDAKFFIITTGSVVSHKDTPIHAHSQQVVVGYERPEQVPDGNVLYQNFVRGMALNGLLPDGINVRDIVDLSPVEDPVAALNNPVGPFYLSRQEATDSQLSTAGSLKVYEASARRPCPNENCEWDWVLNFQIAIHETTEAEAALLILTMAQDEGYQL